MKLDRCCEVRLNFPEADFWLVPRIVPGMPTWQFRPDYIGVRVLDAEKFPIRYVFLCFQHRFICGDWRDYRQIATEDLRCMYIMEKS